MKVRTLEELQTVLDGAMAWRRKELIDIDSAIGTANGNTERTYIRAGVALLYAHWEGFIKEAAEAYLTYIAAKRCKVDELRPSFAALALKGTLSPLNKSEKVRFGIAAVKAIRDLGPQEAKFPSKGLVVTSSNLTSEVLREIVERLSLDYSPFQLEEKLIDESLVGGRNRIAHGEYLIVKASDFSALHAKIVSLMDSFRDSINTAAQNNAFREAA